MRFHRIPRRELALACASGLVGALHCSAQCSPTWEVGGPLESAFINNGLIYTAAGWDPDGSGPAPPGLVIAGLFSGLSGVAASSIAFFDLATGTWSPLGSGLNGTVWSLGVTAAGELVAGGDFSTAGGAPANRIAKWNGNTWSTLGSGMDGGVYAFAVLPNGHLVAGGGFTLAGGLPAARIAEWNGSTWSGFGSGMDGSVSALAVLPNGNLVAGGGFTQAGGLPAANIAEWNGSSWSPLGSGMDSNVSWLTVARNGTLIAAGSFTTAGGIPAGVARWNGAVWSSLGTGQGNVFSVLPNGDLVAAGSSMNTSSGTR